MCQHDKLKYTVKLFGNNPRKKTTEIAHVSKLKRYKEYDTEVKDVRNKYLRRTEIKISRKLSQLDLQTFETKLKEFIDMKTPPETKI